MAPFKQDSRRGYSNLIGQSILLWSMQTFAQSGSPLALRIESAQEKVLEWLKCGMAPRQLAFTLALGFAIGCIPLLGVTTGICALLAIVLRLNMPAIQAANWLAMPVQVLLLIPFLRFGQWIFAGRAMAGRGMVFNGKEILARIEAAPWQALKDMSGLLGHGLVAWVITAVPALLVMTLLLTPLMRRVAALANDRKLAEVAGD
jgi:uncharacterized protein (DUF2062 family)